MSKYEDIPLLIREFLIYAATVKGRSANTVRSYYYDLKSFLKFIVIRGGGSADFADIDVADVGEEIIRNCNLMTALEFLHYLGGDRDNNASSRARRAVSLKRFYAYLTDVKQMYEISPLMKLELPRVKPALPLYLTVEQAVLLIKTCAYDNSFAGRRDYCILTFFMNCGMRLSELQQIDVNDVKKFEDEGKISYNVKVHGKGGKERVLYFNAACVHAYEQYLACRLELADTHMRLAHEKSLFLSTQYRRISVRRIQQVIEDRLKSCGLDNMGFSVHKLRHTAATLMYQNGVDVRILKEVLGHANLGTTQIYTHVVNKQVRDALDNNPLGSFT
ncbi:tyrosine recombinase XerC [Clostridia bacterium]|nr:tyrosine recombinase XerC [Clostridia bacterium]